MDSLFSRLFSYRPRMSHSPLENFTTEAFSFCLEIDLRFRDEFLKNILKIRTIPKQFNIATQITYDKYGRPDIEVVFSDVCILFECKIEATERVNQLSNYAGILMNEKSDLLSKHIVYITKYFEHKEINTNSVKLHLIRWFDIYRLIDDTHLEITQQFKLFLKENDMDAIKNFTIQDILAMKEIPSAISKMDELLEMFKPEFEKNFGGYSKDSSRSSQLRKSIYINYVTLTFERNNYWLLIGFFWWWGEDVQIPYVGISVEIPTKKFENSELISILDKELGNKEHWEIDKDDVMTYYSALKPLTDFMTQTDDNIPTIKKFIQDSLKTIYKVKDKHPKLFKK